MRLYRLVVPVALLAACSGGGSTPPPPSVGDFQLSLSSESLTLSAGSASLQVSLSRSGGLEAPVTLSLVRIPSSLKLNGSFSPNPVALDSTLTLSPGSGLAPGSYTLLVRGRAEVAGQQLQREAEFTLVVPPPSTLTVSGQVRNRFGRPLAGVPVCSGSRCVNTDAQGRFTHTGMTAPYSLTVRPIGSQEHTFVGLERPDPLLLLYSSAGAPSEQSANLSGNLVAGSGVTLPNPANTVAQVVFAAPSAKLTQFVPPSDNLAALFPGQVPSYSLKAVWYGNASVGGRLHALQWRHVPGVPGTPQQFLAYGSRPASLSAGVSQTLNLGLSPIETGALSVELKNLGLLTLRSRQLYVNLEARSLFLVASETAGSPLSLAWPTPVIPGKSLTFAAYADASDGRSSSLQVSGLGPYAVLEASLATPPVLLSPGSGQSNVSPGASLSWNRPAQSISLLILSAPGQPTRTFYTQGDALTPGLQAGTSYSWLVQVVGPFADMNEFTGPRWLEGYPSFGWDETFFQANSPLRTFSTSP